MELSERRLGELDCRIVAAADNQVASENTAQGLQLGVVLCHGYGAPGDDLVPLAPEVFQRRHAFLDRVAFFFPSAPILMDSMGGYESRAWWPIDMERMMTAVEHGKLDLMRRENPPEMPDARIKLESTLQAIESEFGLSKEKLIVGGFSQGAMLSTEIALHSVAKPAGVCLFSGALIKEDEWTKAAAASAPLDVLQSHGTVDPILPFESGKSLNEMLVSAGHQVEFLPFQGVHTIPMNAVDQLAEMIERKLK